DGHSDILLGGNLYESEPTAPRADAGNGLWLRGDGQGGFTPVPPMQSELVAPGDVRDLQIISTGTGRQLVISNVADSIQVFQINQP
ncbi:MAG: hypothetical protein RI573_16875, partial [Balneolaceae bacterium]|nr:hypothetical protein [Balneolaceae bacterium]